ncbi:elongation of fatty acids protein 3-like [Quercus suber]|uniref:Elongation of fatty acids protein 3-like n=1 Tax=Quercus suber TaxID=58331 RepID=A0AAW0MBR6_QUESU
MVYGYRFWTAIGLPSACFPFVVNCQVVLLQLVGIVCFSGKLRKMEEVGKYYEIKASKNLNPIESLRDFLNQI